MRTWNPHWMVKVLLFTASAVVVWLCVLVALIASGMAGALFDGFMAVLTAVGH